MIPLVFSISNQSLLMNGNAYKAVSGPYKNGHLPMGEYDVSPLVDVENHPVNIGFCFEDTCFWIKLTPKFETTRTGLGIHPDGNIPGTLGCIGLVEYDSQMFYWDYLDLKEKPNRLVVVE